MRRHRLFMSWFGFRVYGWNIPLPLPGAYRVTCLDNGKQYVGSSRNIEYRFANGWQQASNTSLLGAAILIHGKQRFVIEPLFYDLTGHPLAAVEERLIDQHSCLHPDGYNAVLAGNGARTFSAINNDDALERRRRAGIIAYARTVEAQKRFRKQWNDATIQARAAASRLASPLWHEAVSRPRTVEEIAKVQTPEIRAKRARSVRRAWTDPELREAQSNRLRDYLSDPDNYARRVKQIRKVQAKATAAARKATAGTIWITDGTVGKRVQAGATILKGWRRGKPDKRKEQHHE